MYPTCIALRRSSARCRKSFGASHRIRRALCLRFSACSTTISSRSTVFSTPNKEVTARAGLFIFEFLSRSIYLVEHDLFRKPVPTFRNHALIAAKDGRVRCFSGPDLSETNGLQGGRLRAPSDELVFENTCVRASGRNATDQEIGARRRAGCGDPCAGRPAERLEARDFTKVSAVVVVQRALQIQWRAAVQCRAARKDLYRTTVRK